MSLWSTLDDAEREFAIKDSGKRNEFESGMVRDTEEGKLDYTLVLDGPMFKRWATHLTKGAEKYEARNWMKAEGEAEMERAKRSLLRHVFAYLDGEVDEDHAAAAFFNINQIEYIKDKLAGSEVCERGAVKARCADVDCCQLTD